MTVVNLLVEGPSDGAILGSVLRACGLEVGNIFGLKGKEFVLTNVARYNEAARFSPWAALVDQDHPQTCPPNLVSMHLPTPAEGMCFRVAVMEIESWLLGDAVSIARFLQVSRDLVPLYPESLADPKLTMIRLAAHSRSRLIRQEMVGPSGSQEGPGYSGRIVEYVSGKGHTWRPMVAADFAPSLKRCMDALRHLAA